MDWSYNRRHARVGTGDTAMDKNVLMIVSQPYISFSRTVITKCVSSNIFLQD